MIHSFSEAESLCHDMDNGLRSTTITRHFTLPWRFLGKEARGVKTLLERSLRCYNDELGGVAMAFGRASLLHKPQRVIEDHACIHLDRLVQCVLFEPKFGSILNATVSKATEQSPWHPHKNSLYCLVHGVFPCHVTYTNSRSCSAPQLGDRVRFRVSRMESHSKILILGGQLLAADALSDWPDLLQPTQQHSRFADHDNEIDSAVSHDVVERLPRSIKMSPRKHSVFTLEPEDETEPAESLVESRDHRRKRKHSLKHRTKLDEDVEEIEPEARDSSSGVETGAKERKHKPRKRKLDGEQSSALEDSSTASEMDGKSKKKKRRKEKHYETL